MIHKTSIGAIAPKCLCATVKAKILKRNVPILECGVCVRHPNIQHQPGSGVVYQVKAGVELVDSDHLGVTTYHEIRRCGLAVHHNHNRAIGGLVEQGLQCNRIVIGSK